MPSKVKKQYFVCSGVIYFIKKSYVGDLMTTKKRFIRDGIMLSLVALLTRSVSMAFSAFLSGAVGSEGLGLFTLVMTVYSFALTLATSGVGLAVTRAVAADPDSRRGTLSSALIYSAIFGSLSCALLIAFAPLICLRLISAPSALPLLQILALSLPATAITSALGGYFIGVRRVRANALLQIFSQLFRIVLSYSLVTAQGRGDASGSLRLICLATLITEIASLALMAIQYFIDETVHKSPLIKRGKLSDISSVALPLALSQYVRSALISIEHILIPKRLIHGGLSSEQALSGYGILHGMALPAVLLPMSPLSSFSGLLVPEFARDEAVGNKARMSALTCRAIRITFAYASLAAAVIFTFSAELGEVIYSSSEAGRYLSFLAPVIPIMYLDHVSDQILKGVGEQVYSMWVNIADSALSLILVFFLLPRLLVPGYALVIILMEAFNFIMSVSRLARRVSLKGILTPRLLIPLPEAALACFLSAILFSSDTPPTSPFTLLCKILFAICAFVFLDRIINAILCNIDKMKKTLKKK